ncbi:MAG: MerR family transcriptional regulator [Coprobacillus sp.]
MENKYRPCQVNQDVKLYKIGLFSQMTRLTIKTLRYYDDIDLLKPSYVDEINGYRYYTSAQLPTLYKIISLRDMGLSIPEIKDVLAGKSEEKVLIKKKTQLLKEIAELNNKLACIEGYLSGDCLDSKYRVVMKSLPEVIVASMRVHLNSYDDLFHKMPEMGHEMEKRNCECALPEYCYTMYYDDEYKENDVDVEICESVTELKEDTQKVQFKVVSEVELAACTLHLGPYTRLPQAYMAVVKFIEESGYEIIGHVRESYIDGIWNKETDEEWLTEIQIPVRKIKAENIL